MTCFKLDIIAFLVGATPRGCPFRFRATTGGRPYMTTLFVLLSNFIFPNAATAADQTRWERSISLGFNLTQGNSDTVLINSDLKAETPAVSKDDLWRFELGGSYGESDDKKNIAEVQGVGEYRHIFNKLWFGVFGVDWLTDDIADVDYRTLVYPGLGYYFFKEKDLELSLNSGPAYIFEKQGGDKDDYPAARAEERFKIGISDTAILKQSLIALVSAEDAKNSLITAELSLETTIVGNLQLTVSVKNEYDNVPAKDKKRNDVEVISGLQFQF